VKTALKIRYKLLLYFPMTGISIGCAELGVFLKGKDVSACIGVTPIQYSSGGKTVLAQ